MRGRRGNPTVAADAEEMPDQQDAAGQDQSEDMPGVEADQHGRTRFQVPGNEADERLADFWHGRQQVRPRDQCPADALVPAQDVAGEIQQERDHEQSQPEQVVEAARPGVRAGEDDSQKMDGGDHRQRLRRPEMQVAYQSAKRDEEGDLLHGLGGALHRGDVVVHLQQACHQQHQAQEDRQSARAEGVTKARLQGGDARRVQVQDKTRTRRAARQAGLEADPGGGQQERARQQNLPRKFFGGRPGGVLDGDEFSVRGGERHAFWKPAVQLQQGGGHGQGFGFGQRAGIPPGHFCQVIFVQLFCIDEAQ